MKTIALPAIGTGKLNLPAESVNTLMYEFTNDKVKRLDKKKTSAIYIFELPVRVSTFQL